MLKKLLFLLLFGLFACSKSDVDLKIVDASDIYKQVETHRGKEAVLVNFWATHCSPCIEQFPMILELGEEYKNQGLKIYFVSTDWLDRKEAVLEFLQNIGVKGVSFLTDELDDNEFINAIHQNWSGALPFTLAFDKNGNLIDYWENKKDRIFFDSVIKKVLSP